MSSSAEQFPRKKNHRGRAPDPPRGESNSTRPDKEFTIAVMGVTGSGKSSLIRELTDNSGVGVSDSLNSFTTEVTPYSFQHEGITITLVDTPGFNDTSRSDLEVLTAISTWATETYGKGHLLSGIIYLHRISDVRMQVAGLRALRLFKSLVGEKFMKNVLLTTTHWSRVTQEEGERREKELRDGENFWKGLLDHGATLKRYEGHRQSGFELLREIVPYRPRVLDIQHEFVDQRENLVETSVGWAIKEELRRMQGRQEEDMKILQDEFREAVVAGDDEARDILERERKATAAKVEQLRAARRKLSKIQSPAKALLYRNELGLLPDKEALLIYVKGAMEIGNVGRSGSLLSSMLDPAITFLGLKTFSASCAFPGTCPTSNASQGSGHQSYKRVVWEGAASSDPRLPSSILVPFYQFQMPFPTKYLPKLVGCCPQGQEYRTGRPGASIPSSGGKSTSTASNKETVIVMGVTGSGKSSLIREITGNSEVEVSDGLKSCRAGVTPYTFHHDGREITLVDTPGFSDTIRSDLEVLKEVSKWAAETYGKGHLLSGIIYLHRISDNRMDGSALRGLRLLKGLVGENNLKNVLLTTTRWSGVTREEGERREKELRENENFWKGLLDRGATLARYAGDRQSGLGLLRKIVPSEPKALDIQGELVDQRKKLADTSAGRSVKEEWSEWERVLEKHEEC